MVEIKRIEIIGLNHKCNVSFDLTEDCTILIGENGVGKTSALKILQFLLSGMMSSVASYIFEYIRITDSEKIYEFSKDDFLVPIDVITESFVNECLQESDEEQVSLLKKYFKEMILEIKEKELLGKFLDELYYLDSFSSVLSRIIEKYVEEKV